MNYNQIMVDIETLGTGSNPCLLSIGAVAFSLDRGDKFNAIHSAPFYEAIRIDDPAQGKISAETLKWWLTHDAAVRDEAFGGRRDLDNVLGAFSIWLSHFSIDGFWSNGPMFDERILRETFSRREFNFEVPFRASRDVRTIIQIAQAMGLPKPQRTGDKHNALHDARYQAEGVIEVFKQLPTPMRFL